MLHLVVQLLRESIWVSFFDVHPGYFDLGQMRFRVAALVATTFLATVIPTSEALTIKLQAFAILAVALRGQGHRF